MAVINDRDLLVRDPSLFVSGVDGATILRTTSDGSVSGTTVTSASSNFVALDVTFGHVAVINDVPCEVVSRTSGTQLTVSLPRSSTSEPLITPASGPDQRVVIPTFKRLSDLAEAWALGALGIDSNDPVQPLSVADIASLEALKHLVALRTIQQAWAIAAAGTPANDSLKERSLLYAANLAQAKRQTEVLLKLDGDGAADSTRRFDVVTLMRN